MEPSTSAQGPTVLRGILHVFVAFDWGEEIALDKVHALVPTEPHALPRRRRTPSSVGFRPPPLRFVLSPPVLEVPELGRPAMTAEATVFDFAAVSVALHVPFETSAEALVRLAGHLAQPDAWLSAARTAVEPLFRKLYPAIANPQWQDDLSEEYFVFQFPPGEPLPLENMARHESDWLAGLLRLESEPLSSEEIDEATKHYLTYYPWDLFVPDWAAACLVDEDCDETLHAIEFANLQLLEYRHIDNRLDVNLAQAYGLIHKTVVSRWPLWGGTHKALRAIGELKVEANGLFERTGNVLKLVGDQYLARVYRLLATRFHLKEWERNIQRKLEVISGVYEVISDQSEATRTEFLEVIVVVLIIIEVVVALVKG
jgi:hypothetical protein